MPSSPCVFKIMDGGGADTAARGDVEAARRALDGYNVLTGQIAGLTTARQGNRSYQCAARGSFWEMRGAAPLATPANTREVTTVALNVGTGFARRACSCTAATAGFASPSVPLSALNYNLL
ncbi:hypothetical protein MLPF_1486 [Mycobacterium lepromatosis]|nr:hypothetical protein MLPF_1486 [Mycobacterium lepromatosis]